MENCFRYIYHVGNYADWGKLKGIMPFLLKKSGNEMLTSRGMMPFDLLESEPEELVGARWETLPHEQPSLYIYGKKDKKVLYIRLDNFVYPRAAQEIAAALLQNSKGVEALAKNALAEGDSPAKVNVGEEPIKRDYFAGVILDIRNNIGGMTAYAAKVAELFLSGEFSACQKKTRMMKGLDLASASQYAGMGEKQIESCIRDGLCTGEEVERCLRTAKNMNYYEYQDSFGAPGHRAAFDGPVVLLTTRGTISAAEDFTAMFKSTHRAVLMGEPTYGSTGTPFLKRLRLGGSFQVCSVGYRLLDGTEFIGKGIMPDILMEEEIGDYACGRDKVFDCALKRLGAWDETREMELGVDFFNDF